MGKAQEPGPGSRVDNPQDVQVTGDLPMSMTTFVGRERELDELWSLFRERKRPGFSLTGPVTCRHGSS